MQENQETKDPTQNLLDTLFTPKQIAERGVLSLVKQWKEREGGRLKFCQIGRKILYSEQHINDYLALCQREAETLLRQRQDQKRLQAA